MLTLIVASLIATTAPPPRGDEFRILAGPDFEALTQAVAARCPISRVIYAKPAVLLDAEETFEAGLSARRLATLNRLINRDSEIQRCATRNGASCTAGAMLGVYRRAGLMSDFVTAVCRRGDASWG